MAKRTYNKAPLTFESQLNLLQSRGLNVKDKAKALSYLQEISYYRLSAYFKPYQQVKDVFNEGVSFQQIISTYSFDRELRLLIFDCIERIEVAIRTQFIYEMAVHHKDSHWQDKKRFFIEPYTSRAGHKIDPYSDLQDIILRAKSGRRPEVFIKHYIENYNSPVNPPSWMCLELLTMGELSHIYRGLKINSDRKRIADFFDVHPTVFGSWLHALTYVRNICAHHSRLWNRDLAIEPLVLQKPVGKWIAPEFENNKRVFYFICMMRYMLLRANPGNSLPKRLETLFDKYTSVPIQYLGIPSSSGGSIKEWKQEELWQ